MSGSQPNQESGTISYYIIIYYYIYYLLLYYYIIFYFLFIIICSFPVVTSLVKGINLADLT